jgi:hypothetical protein
MYLIYKMDYSQVLCKVGLDSLVYAGTKYTLHRVIDYHKLKDINFGDIVSFAIIDGIYYIFLRDRIAMYFSNNEMAAYVITKYGTIILGVSIINFISGRSARIVDNLINIGASGAITEGVQFLLGNYANTESEVTVIATSDGPKVSLPAGGFRNNTKTQFGESTLLIGEKGSLPGGGFRGNANGRFG